MFHYKYSMISSIKYCLYTFMVLTFFSCEKLEVETPDQTSDSETPVFYSEFDFNGENIMLNAGDNDFYMFTSPPVPSDSLIIYSSVEKTTDCRSSCDQRFTLEVFDINNIDLSLQEYVFPFGGGGSVPQAATGNLDFFVDSPNSSISINWSMLTEDALHGDTISVSLDQNSAVVIDPIEVQLENGNQISFLLVSGLLSNFFAVTKLKGISMIQGTIPLL